MTLAIDVAGPRGREASGARAAPPELPVALRAALLFANFFFIILAYYQLKPASRSLFLGHVGHEALPFMWIGTALSLGVLIAGYHRLVARVAPAVLTIGTGIVAVVLLLVLRLMLGSPGPVTAVLLYGFADIFSVVLVEQFWSLTNTLHTSDAGRRWYGFLGTGGLLGGAVGGWVAAVQVQQFGLATEDLLVSAACVMGVVVAVNVLMLRSGLYLPSARVRAAATAAPHGPTPPPEVHDAGRYVFLVAALLLLAQVVEPIVEYQLNATVAERIADTDARTAFLSSLFATLSALAIGVNLLVTPLVLRTLGPVGGLALQPALTFVASIAFLWSPVLGAVSALKVADRGLSYSVNRAARELLYVPMDVLALQRMKAWIDMFGYRVFKVAGSLAILAVTGVAGLDHVALVGLTLPVCLLWLWVVAATGRHYAALLRRTQPSP